ncbi:MAG TPA: HlyD family efflux transporter periplasmic adaptor subunit, partial [Ignavibacteriaceae bacterium]|nr:HlyD family efflux transporter periplasmic adaptor subunit [Ignavibacteriaceae bacterium]
MDKKIEKKPLFKRKKFWFTSIGAAILLILIISILVDTGSKLNVEADKITISTVSEGDFQEFIPVAGNVLPQTTYYLDAILGGNVQQKFVEEGAMLRKGDKILRLSNTDFQLSALQQESFAFQQINDARNTRLSIEQNSINLQTRLVDVNYSYLNNKQLFNRAKVMWEKKLISLQDYEQARDNYYHDKEQKKLAEENFQKDSVLKQSQLEQIGESIKRLQLNLGLIRENLDNLTVKAPISGQLTSLNAEIGQSKSPGSQLGQIDALDGFKVRADIDEYYIARVVKGLHATAEIDGKDYRLVVIKVFPEVKNGKFQVDMNFEGTVPGGIRRGQTLQIRLQLSERTK